jgi:hypothetical protein
MRPTLPTYRYWSTVTQAGVRSLQTARTIRLVDMGAFADTVSMFVTIIGRLTISLLLNSLAVVLKQPVVVTLAVIQIINRRIRALLPRRVMKFRLAKLISRLQEQNLKELKYVENNKRDDLGVICIRIVIFGRCRQ